MWRSLCRLSTPTSSVLTEDARNAKECRAGRFPEGFIPAIRKHRPTKREVGCRHRFDSETLRLLNIRVVETTEYVKVERSDQTELIATFWSHVTKGETEDACWEWDSSILKETRPRIHVQLHDRVEEYAHRFSFFMANGYWAENTLHTCDNSRCVSWRHLYDGTQAQNAQDREARGRRNPVTDDQRTLAHKMLDRGFTQNEIAFATQTSQTWVSNLNKARKAAERAAA